MGAEFFFGAGHFFLTLRQNAQQAVAEVEELLFRGHPEVVDADLAEREPSPSPKREIPTRLRTGAATESGVRYEPSAGPN